MLKKRYFMCDLYFALFVLYYILSAIQPSSTTALLLIMVIAISLYYCFRVIKLRNLPLYFKGLNVFLLLLTIYGLILAVFHGPIHIKMTGDIVNSNTNIRFLLGSMLSIYPCYYFARNGQLTEKRLKVWAFVFLGTVIISYFYAQIHHVQRALSANISVENASDFTNNVGYTFLLLMPIVALFRKSKILYFSYSAICLLFILSAAKRGAILIGLTVSILLIYKYFNKLKLTQLKKTIAYMVMIALLLCAAIWVYNYIETNDFLSRRLMSMGEGNSSGRDYITEYFWKMYTEKFSLVQLLFGGGADYTIITGPNYAHNDWLEVLINEGIIGVICYLYYWLCFYLTYKKYKKYDYGYVIGIIIIILFAKTIFSMSYTAMNLYVCSMLGFCLAQCQKQELISRTHRLKKAG